MARCLEDLARVAAEMPPDLVAPSQAFVGYAPADKPTIALAVVVEGGGYGASTGSPTFRLRMVSSLMGMVISRIFILLWGRLASRPYP
mgnify:CR=1 FL=1